MQVFRSLETEDVALVGWGVSVLLATASGIEGLTARRLAGLGGQVDVVDQLYDALSQVLDDPRTAQLLVIDCDAFGGLAAGRRAFAILENQAERLPIILISAECQEQTYPHGREAPIVLRSPVSSVALRIAFETAFRRRFLPGF